MNLPSLSNPTGVTGYHIGLPTRGNPCKSAVLTHPRYQEEYLDIRSDASNWESFWVSLYPNALFGYLYRSPCSLRLKGTYRANGLARPWAENTRRLLFRDDGGITARLDQGHANGRE
jgi:hypothetical protein